jgi:hypothetical protein
MAMEEEDDVIGGDDLLEGGEVLWRPPFFQSPSPQSIMPDEDDGAAALADLLAEGFAKEIQTVERVVPWGLTVIDGPCRLTGKQIELDEVEWSPVPGVVVVVAVVMDFLRALASAVASDDQALNVAESGRAGGG